MYKIQYPVSIQYNWYFEIFCYRKVFSEDLQRAITLTDPEIDSVQLEAILFWAYRVKDKTQLEEAPPVPYADVEQRLINGNIKRAGPKP